MVNATTSSPLPSGDFLGGAPGGSFNKASVVTADGKVEMIRATTSDGCGGISVMTDVGSASFPSYMLTEQA